MARNFTALATPFRPGVIYISWLYDFLFHVYYLFSKEVFDEIFYCCLLFTFLYFWRILMRAIRSAKEDDATTFIARLMRLYMLMA